jgi:chromosome segregation ATPase
MGNPFEDTEVDATEGKPEVREGDLVVDLTEPVSAKEPDDVRLTRDEKKQQRSAERWDDRERELRETRDRMSSLERELQEIRQSSQRREEAPRSDPFQTKLDDVYQRRRDLAARYTAESRRDGGISKPERDEFEKRAKDLEMEQMELVASRAAVRLRPAQPDPELTAIRARHYDVLSHPQAAKWANAVLEQTVAEGAQVNPTVIDEIADRARGRFGLAGPRKVSDAEKSKYTGAPKAGQVSSKEPPSTYRMTKDDKKMADSLYSHIKDDSTRYRTWVKEVAMSAEKE